MNRVDITVSGAVVDSTSTQALDALLLNHLRKFSFKAGLQAVLPFYLTDTQEAVAILDELSDILVLSRERTLDVLSTYANANGLRVTLYETRPQVAGVIAPRSEPVAGDDEVSEEVSEEEPKMYGQPAEVSGQASCAGPAPEPVGPTFYLLNSVPARARNIQSSPGRLFYVRVGATPYMSLSQAMHNQEERMRNCGYPAWVSLRLNDGGIGEIELPLGPTLFLAHAVRCWDEPSGSQGHLYVYAVPDDAYGADLIPLVEPGGPIPALSLVQKREILRGGEPLPVETLHELSQAAAYGTVITL